LTTYKVVSGDALESIAKRHGTTLERLLEINNIPESDKNKLSIGQELSVPGAAGSSSGSGDTTIIKPEDPTPVTPVRDVHVVESGDNLSRIAVTYGVSLSALKAKNNLQDDRIQIGQRLLIPVPSSAVVPVPEDPPAGQVVHVVKSGDNYTKIANRYGVTVADLGKWNPDANPNRLQLGQKLIVKAPSSPPPSDDDDSSDGAGKEEESIDSLFNKPPVVPLPAKEEEEE
jgi:LysM repeat protein